MLSVMLLLFGLLAATYALLPKDLETFRRIESSLFMVFSFVIFAGKVFRFFFSVWILGRSFTGDDEL